jgi:hypothetical protein
MATGDAGAAKGLRVIANTKAINLGYDDLNKKADEIAAEMDARAAADATLTADKLDKSKIIVQTATPAVVTGGIWFKPV